MFLIKKDFSDILSNCLIFTDALTVEYQPKPIKPGDLLSSSLDLHGFSA